MTPAVPGNTPVDDSAWLAFREQVHGALVRLYDPPALETHSLAMVAMASEQGRGYRTPGRTLQANLLAAIDSIGAADRPRSAESRAARLARLRYVDGQSIERIRDELAIGRSEYFREHARALDAIAAVLRARWGSTSGIRPAWPDEGALPREVTRFVGREMQVSELMNLLRSSPLVTLTGAGGVGKTRLALAAARAIARGTQGTERATAWFVDLSGLLADGGVDQAVAATLRLRENAGQSLAEALISYLSGEARLVVLDNCEHVAPQCARLVTALLTHCPMLTVLATSREPLRVAGELIYRVPPLEYPESDPVNDLHALSKCEAVRLFVERARAVRPGFRLVDQNSLAVAQICRRLEGVPLALELAAARLGGLSAGQLAARLNDSLRVLTVGDRGGAARHQTLRAAMDWSHELLRDSERTLFQRLSVFSGGWTLEAAEVVCAGAGGVMEDLLSLVDKSMIVADLDHAGAERYHLLEIVRQYAREQLETTSEEAEIERRHAIYFRNLAKAAVASGIGPQEEEWFDQIEREVDNFRAALRWSTQHEIEPGLVIGAALWRFWYIRGSIVEGRNWLATLLQHADPSRSETRAAALFAATQLAIIQGASVAARPLAEESLAIRKWLGDEVGVGCSTHALAHCTADSSTERRLLTEAVAVLRQTPGDFWLAWTLHCLANAMDLSGEETEGRRIHDESLQLFKRNGNRWGIALGLIGMGLGAARRSDFGEARGLYEQGLALQRELKIGYLSDTLNALGRVDVATGRLDRAVERFRESLEHCRAHGARWEGAFSLEGLADVALARAQAPAAVRFLGAAASIRTQLAAELTPKERAAFDGLVARAQTSLDPATFATEWATGSALTWAEAVSESSYISLGTSPMFG